jgi:hypothetical protein
MHPLILLDVLQGDRRHIMNGKDNSSIVFGKTLCDEADCLRRSYRNLLQNSGAVLIPDGLYANALLNRCHIGITVFNDFKSSV